MKIESTDEIFDHPTYGSVRVWLFQGKVRLYIPQMFVERENEKILVTAGLRQIPQESWLRSLICVSHCWVLACFDPEWPVLKTAVACFDFHWCFWDTASGRVRHWFNIRPALRGAI
jgi:hypothetical protein